MSCVFWISLFSTRDLLPLLFVFRYAFVVEAVPKKILELMNDERLTRENVASHLQVKSGAQVI